jgi:hypothetical protein
MIEQSRVFCGTVPVARGTVVRDPDVIDFIGAEYH